MKLSDDCKRGNHLMVQVATFQNRDGTQVMLERCLYCSSTQKVELSPVVPIKEDVSGAYPMEDSLFKK